MTDPIAPPATLSLPTTTTSRVLRRPTLPAPTTRNALTRGELALTGFSFGALVAIAAAIVLLVRGPMLPAVTAVVAALVTAALLVAVALAMALTLQLNSRARAKRLRDVANELGVGDLSARAPTEPLDDYGQTGLALNVMADRLGRLLQAQRDLLAGVSHELRSPLARIEVAVELVRSELAGAELNDVQRGETSQLLESIGEEVQLLEQHIARLLEAQRVSAEGSLPRRTDVSLDELIEQVLRREARRLEHLGWTIETQLGLAGSRMTGDTNALDRALSTLVENAVQHAGEGVDDTGRVAERRLRIETEREPGHRAVVRILDRGPGLTLEQCGRVFEAFFRTDRSRSSGTGGSGLGLYLVRRITEAHGGTSRAIPRPGGGLVIELRLPLTGGLRESKETIRMSLDGATDRARTSPPPASDAPAP